MREPAKTGSDSVWLNRFQAHGFYKALGCTMFGQLEDYSEDQMGWFLRKRLAQCRFRSGLLQLSENGDGCLRLSVSIST